MKEIYEQEFDLNLKHQIVNPKEVMQVGYTIDNMTLFTLIIPNVFIPKRRNKKDDKCDPR